MKTWLLLLFISLIYSQTIELPAQDDTCKFYSYPTTSIYLNPISSSKDTVCAAKGEKTCCSPDYLDSIKNGTDTINSTVSLFFDTITENCSAAMSTLFCAPCKKDSYVWSEKLGNLYKLNLCSKYCDYLYNSCADSTTTMTRTAVSSLYSSSRGFCSAFLVGSDVYVNVRPDSDHSCYNPLAPQCSGNDLVYYYTECVNNRRELHYDWQVDSECSGGIELPTSVSNLVCPISCGSGMYLPLGTENCKQCKAGTFSLGGGYRVHEWNEWPNRGLIFTSYCQYYENSSLLPAESCSGWSLNGTFIESNIKRRSNVKSVLYLPVELKHNGTVSFTCEIDSENGYDKLYFEVDGASQWIPNSIEEKTYTFGLTSGFHVLRWIYSKDISIDQGLDRAIIYSIEVLSMAEHSDFCTPCAPGTVSGVGSTSCTECPYDTFSNSDDLSSCQTCPTNEYALPGSGSCTLRDPCTADDMQHFYLPCSSEQTRTRYWRWVEPKICLETNVSLPDPELGLPCAPCNPGEYRLGAECVSCETGYYSDGSECKICPAGSAAPKQLAIHNWDQLETNMTTHCVGECGSSGWRLRSTYIDSGVDHGAHADVMLTVEVDITDSPGEVFFEYALNCQGWCYLEFYDNGKYVTSEWYNPSSPGLRNVTFGPYIVQSLGIHNFTWGFRKFHSTRNQDQAIIYKIEIDGVREGGSGKCEVCPPGRYSDRPSSSCTPCPNGMYSDSNATGCLPCPENTYADGLGTATCKACPPGTTTSSGSSECSINNCQYTPPNSEDVYDFSGLSREVEDVWKLEETGSTGGLHLFYFNPCNRMAFPQNSTTCRDSNGAQMLTYACQYLADPRFNYSVDLGHVQGYLPYKGPEKGAIITFTEGTPSCGDAIAGLQDVPRRMNITLICDPSEGTGKPQPEGTTIERWNPYPDVCGYSIKWRSIYGCPLCTENDYHSLKQSCQGGQQWISYEWNENPKSCHGGVRLPAPYKIACNETVSCGIGTYLNGDDKCEPCQGNTYSLGNAEIFNTQGESIAPLNTTCEGEGCEGWSSVDRAFESGSGKSKLQLDKNFRSVGGSYIEFEYYYTGQGTDFVFMVDYETVLVVNTYSSGYKKYNYPVSVGTHRFQWMYTSHRQNFTDQRENFVRIRNIVTRGSILATAQCKQCPDGFVTDGDKGGCHECPPNTYAVGDLCDPCENNKYRLLGQGSQCSPKIQCTDNQFLETFPNIQNNYCGKTDTKPITSVYVVYEPNVCANNPPSGKTYSNCIDCPSGLYYDSASSSCKACSEGKYLTRSGCVDVSTGYTAVPTARLFTPNDPRRSLDDYNGVVCGIETKCFGSCSSDGWHVHGSALHSGLHFGEVESVFIMNVTTDPKWHTTPVVSFKLKMEDTTFLSSKRAETPKAGVEFYIDNVIQVVPFNLQTNVETSFTFQIAGVNGGNHTLKWIYTQPFDLVVPHYVLLSDVSITGALNGAAEVQTECPPGTYFSSPRCVPCPAGKFSNTSQSLQCSNCPGNSVSSSGSTRCYKCGRGTTSTNNKCYTDCIFENTYDLTSLKNSAFSIVPNSGNSSNYLTFQLSPCDTFIPSNCRDAACQQQSAYVFGEFTDDLPKAIPRSLGAYISYQPKEVIDVNTSSTASVNTFDLTYTDGVNTPNGCSQVNTTISFYCAPREGKGVPEVSKVDDKCNPHFVWKSLYACPMCTSDDLIKEPGVCKNGNREILYKYKRACYGALPSLTAESCEDVEIGFNTAVIAVSVAGTLLLIGAGVAFYFWYTKRQMEIKYEILRNESNMDEDAL
eukprot:TRINITY_DN355_c0_g1_i1.p1 TRINITY_DN355_c0_g1~~TRINITY_DN355_c0_g1_i1.p1  ORF type:complete len:1776 (+),score=386.00 TRINITY_DN355_c0_g1_i1:7643-12970(+)